MSVAFAQPRVFLLQADGLLPGLVAFGGQAFDMLVFQAQDFPALHPEYKPAGQKSCDHTR